MYNSRTKEQSGNMIDKFMETAKPNKTMQSQDTIAQFFYEAKTKGPLH